jgi:D-alanyl-D-alanine carboxypeptidase (penicillin-binding protein 5/6)
MISKKTKLKLFLFAFILSLPFWLGVNFFEKSLKNVFYWQEISQNPKIFAAQISLEEKLKEMKPIRNKEVEDLEAKASSAISVLFKDSGEERILFEKDIDLKLPIASLTKLMTAKVVLEHYDLSKEIKISKEAVAQEEDFGKLEAGWEIPVKYLLYSLLMESSNDAAFALANDYEGMTREKFINLMNLGAQKLNLQNTHFFNVTGLDTEESGTEMNYSTAADLAKFTQELLKDPLIWEILSTPEFDLYGPELVNTNELLGEVPGIIGGKTGYTEMAKGCFLLALEAPRGHGYLVNVILGAGNGSYRFLEMEKLIDWAKEAYRW